ncbi:MAG: flagellin [Bacillota bacterium]
MRINSNISALNAWRTLRTSDAALGTSLVRLSSGLRITRAADDAAGLAISEKMRGQVRGLHMAMRNAQDGISLLQTAEGALKETHGILQRIRELAVQASTDTLTHSDRAQLQTEVAQLIREIDGIAERTEFNTQALLKGGFGVQVNTGHANYASFAQAGVSFDVSGAKASTTYWFAYVNGTDTLTMTDGTDMQTINLATANIVAAGTTLRFDQFGITMSFSQTANLNTGMGTLAISGKAVQTTAATGADIQIGPNREQTMSLSIGDMRAHSAGLNVAAVSVASSEGAVAALGTVDEAITRVSAERAKLGAYQNRLEYTIANLASAAENMSAAESRIRDGDMAAEMAGFTKNQILLQSGTAMLAQANMKPQVVVQLVGY